MIRTHKKDYVIVDILSIAFRIFEPGGTSRYINIPNNLHVCSKYSYTLYVLEYMNDLGYEYEGTLSPETFIFSKPKNKKS